MTLTIGSAVVLCCQPALVNEARMLNNHKLVISPGLGFRVSADKIYSVLAPTPWCFFKQRRRVAHIHSFCFEGDADSPSPRL